jgi:acetoin:2,6-dichlorophenolindophenol oxidoreductase subunit alpha
MGYSRTLLIDLYVSMLKIRLCEESLVEPILSQEVRCPVHLYTGQEAVAAGVCAALNRNDTIFGTHRSHGHYLAKGGDMASLVAEIYGKESGCSRGRGGSMHICQSESGILGALPIVGGTIALATGSALAFKIRHSKNVAVSFFGDGATGEGVLYESLNFAALKKLPIIFVCENNLYSTHLPIRECRPNNDIYKIGSAYGIKSVKADGNDVLKVYVAAKEAAALCREGNGPVFLEFSTYRMRGHVGPDDNVQGTHTDIRPRKEIEKWGKKDPIKRFEALLLKKRVLDAGKIERIRSAAASQVEKAHLAAKKSPWPNPEELNKYVYK